MAAPLLPGPLWLIGCGNMAGAMLEGWIAAGIDPSQISVVRPSGRPVGKGIRVLTAYPDDEVPAMVLLGTEPYQIDEVASGLAPIMQSETILVSILAGVESASHRQRFPTPRTIVRAMPNTPVKLNKGVVGLFSDDVGTEAKALVTRIMAALGRAEWLPEESLFNVVSALSGSGPAFLYRFIDALAAAGEELGLPKAQAMRLAVDTVEGAASLAAGGVEGPAELAERVASPGGSTCAGLEVLDAGDGLKGLLLRTLQASVRRSLEMAAEARGV